MDDWEIPDDVWLSEGERLALLRIEADLRRDRRLAHRMRSARRMDRARRSAWLLLAVLLLAAASVFVAVMGLRTTDPALLWCFALLWPLTLLQAFRLLRRAARRPRPGGRVTPWL
ncbi:DUF3040 domain-containing protein [Streptomyces sp. NPDC101151]|uniref:DUF3040 domain-containing protein n=1 Tax=Streptomyces sp. NPDC101151 TaxID=3366115 RepID=UPI0038135C3E